jgi:2',3'-cyclic-nucleotide 2'-phosphodiesterase (5'-nucleotidase family)
MMIRHPRLRRLALPGLATFALAAACAPPPPAGPAPEAAPKRVRILHTNDFHGRLQPQTPSGADGRVVGGSAVLAAHFDSARARFDGPTLLLSGGDDMQGTAISNLSWGRSTIDAHNAVRYTAAALGNHEFDWGLDTLRARVAESRFPWMAANVYVAGTRAHPQWVRPWVMVDTAGVRVALIGIALSTTPEIVMAGRVEGLEFGPEVPAIEHSAREARAAGADFVVVTMHVGAVCDEAGTEPEEESTGCEGEMIDIARALTEPVDLIVGGHTHRRVLTEVGGIPLAEAAQYGTAYSLTDLELRDGRAVATRRAVYVPYADEVDADTAVQRLVEEWEVRVRPVTEREIATFAAPMDREGGEFPLGNLIADAHRVATGAHASLVNNGSIRRTMPGGAISYGLLYELQPFQNELVTMEVTGAQLRAALENAIGDEGRHGAHVSGMEVTYDPAAAAGARVRTIRLTDGRTIGDDDVITMGLSEFLATGGDRYTSWVGAPMSRTGLVDVDALADYLRTLPQPVEPPPVGRLQPVR